MGPATSAPTDEKRRTDAKTMRAATAGAARHDNGFRNYMILIKNFILIGLLAMSTLAHGQHRCAADAIKQAKALLIFHNGGETNVSVDDVAKVLPPLRNPVNRRQFFDVLEVRGYVYRANYQMRLVYAQVPGTCALMGQEILERSSP